MKEFKSNPVVVAIALTALFCVGCAGSGGGGCRKGACRVSPANVSDPQQRTEAISKPAAAETESRNVQQTCPVTGETLGSMGPPVPVVVDGKSIQVCCDGCVAAVRKNPDKYLIIAEEEQAELEASARRRAASYDRQASTSRVSENCRSCRAR